MSEIAIKIENLGKQYKIGSEKASYRTLRESLVDVASTPFRRAASLLRGESYGASDLDRTIWALKDVNLEIRQGEVVGVIGPNGAGKSTLLKILSRITDPTEGQALIRGRVGSLLEVGTGFHPELTGRENIYLNGSIMGMSREEIDRKFDEIVYFSEVENFLDTPVKHYSSGMFVRLAFSVAAHLEMEILMVDEVLAVGDLEFQKKCLGKMENVAGEGRTVLFVSHNMPMIKHLCPRSILLVDGNISSDGDTNNVIEHYIHRSEEKYSYKHLSQRTDRTGTGNARYSEISLGGNINPEVPLILPMGSNLSVEVTFQADLSIRRPVFSILFMDIYGNTVLRSHSFESAVDVPTINNGKGRFCCTFYNLPLMHGIYTVALWLGRPRQCFDYIENVARIKIEPADVYGTGVFPGKTNSGVCFSSHDWDFE